MQFANPTDLREAYNLLAGARWKILAGGTDFYPSLGGGRPTFDVLDITNIRSMEGIKRDVDGNWHIGALATWTDVIEHNLPSPFDGLKLSAKEVGSVQIQNRATIVGNICNASPAADGVPPLLTLDAIVKIGSATGEREVQLSEFIQGNRETVLQSHEMVTGIKIPAKAALGASSFLKLGARKYLVISISMVAVRVEVLDHIINDAAIAVGSCSLVAKRLPALEAKIVGRNIQDDLSGLVSFDQFDVLSPIDDVRATRGYRMHAAIEMVRRSIDQTLEGVR